MIEVEVSNRSGLVVEEAAAVDLARRVLVAEGTAEGELGIAFVTVAEMRELKREHLGLDEATDVLSFPIDGQRGAPAGRAAGARRRRPLSRGRGRGLALAARPRCAPPPRARARHGDGSARAQPAEVIAPRRTPSIIESFNYAIEGIIHVLRTQRNMRIHFVIAVAVLVLALAFDVSRLELIALLLAIAFVLIAEMINTAIEAAVDVASTSFDPMAKLAKDIGAGAVLIAAINALAVGYLVFSGQVADESSRLLDKLSEAPAELTLVALVLTTAFVIGLKALSGRGTPLRGGWPSGHAAVAFAGWMAVTLVLDDTAHRFLVSSLALIMALLVAQTRIEAGVHTTLEVAAGGALGALVTLVVFQGFAA